MLPNNVFETSRDCTEKNETGQKKMPIIKIRTISSTHGLVSLTKFHIDRVRFFISVYYNLEPVSFFQISLYNQG